MRGLSSKEVEERRAQGLVNTPVKAPSKTVGEIIRSNVFTYFNFVFIFLAVALFLVKSYRDMTFLPIIFINSMIGIVQELRAKQVLDKLTMLNAPKARVVRDGKTREILAQDLVKDDMVIFKAGDQIPADAVVIDGEAAVNEALLTGEADEIDKTAGMELMSGSFIVSGECTARLTKVGAESYISKLTLQAKAIKVGEQSEIIKSLNRIVSLAGIAIIPIGVVMFVQQYVLGTLTLQQSVQGAAAAIIGMIPEGLFLLASVTLVISAMRLARQQVMLHDMKSIETLARVDVLCVDKTGTITDANMKVEEMVAYEKSFEKILGIFVKAQKDDNVTMHALKQFLKNLKVSEKAEEVFSFSPKDKSSAIVYGGKKYVLGAPSFVLKENFSKYEKDIEKFARKGYRVLVLAQEKKALGLVVLANTVRETAPETFRYFAEQGVEVKVISGDDPLTVSEVAKTAGILHAEKHIDATTIGAKKTMAEAAKEYAVFGRVTPEQKRELVKELQAQGHTVAMTGDGVNDVLALKDADCSIAMASGSEAAVQAAQMVLLESDFSKMPAIVAEGRRVVNNLERSGSLFLVKNVFSFLTAMLTIVFGLSYPLIPTQVSLVTMWSIGVPSFFLAQIPNTSLIRGTFLKNVLSKAVPGGITDVVLVMATLVIARAIGLSGGELSTACTVALGAVGMSFLFNVCWPLNKFRAVIFSSCMVGLVLCGWLLHWLYGVVLLPMSGVILCAVMVGLAGPILFGMTKLHHLISRKFKLPI